MGDSLSNINGMAINYLPKCKNQRKVSFLNETLPSDDGVTFVVSMNFLEAPYD